MIERVIEALTVAKFDARGAEVMPNEIRRIVEKAMLPREPMVKGTIVVVGNRVFRRAAYESSAPWWDYVDQANSDWENICSFGEPITYAVAIEQAELSAKAEDWRRVAIGLFEEFGEAESIGMWIKQPPYVDGDPVMVHKAQMSPERHREIAALLQTP